MDDDQLARLRTLKKTAIVVLYMLAVQPTPVGASNISKTLQINNETATIWLNDLCTAGWVTRTASHNGYMLLINQLFDLLQLESTILQLNRGNSAISESASSATTAATSTNISVKGSSSRKPNRGNSVEFRGNSAVSSTEWENIVDNLKALQSKGIGQPMRQRLAELSHITPALIEAVAAMLKERHGRIQTGLLVNILRDVDECNAIVAQQKQITEQNDPEHWFKGPFGLCRKCLQYPCRCDDEKEEPSPLKRSIRRKRPQRKKH